MDGPHAFTVASDEATFLVFTFELGFEQWFLALGNEVSTYELPPANMPSEAEVAAMQDLAPSYGVELLGPPPDRWVVDTTTIVVDTDQGLAQMILVDTCPIFSIATSSRQIAARKGALDTEAVSHIFGLFFSALPDYTNYFVQISGAF